ncbi:MAG: hypothetical protein H7835_16595, partial [Magnetococcus sp. XQGC-1]
MLETNFWAVLETSARFMETYSSAIFLAASAMFTVLSVRYWNPDNRPNRHDGRCLGDRKHMLDPKYSELYLAFLCMLSLMCWYFFIISQFSITFPDHVKIKFEAAQGDVLTLIGIIFTLLTSAAIVIARHAVDDVRNVKNDASRWM